MSECLLEGVFVSVRCNGFSYGGKILSPRISTVRIFSLQCWDLISDEPCYDSCDRRIGITNWSDMYNDGCHTTECSMDDG